MRMCDNAMHVSLGVECAIVALIRAHSYISSQY